MALMGSMVFSMSALAAPGEDSTVSIVCQDEKDCIEQLESKAKYDGTDKLESV